MVVGEVDFAIVDAIRFIVIVEVDKIVGIVDVHVLVVVVVGGGGGGGIGGGDFFVVGAFNEVEVVVEIVDVVILLVLVVVVVEVEEVVMAAKSSDDNGEMLGIFCVWVGLLSESRKVMALLLELRVDLA